MKLNLSADELLTTTRAVRRRLDTSRPVSRALLEECLEVAMQAPNGSNLNTWRWIIVDDPAKIRIGQELRLPLAEERPPAQVGTARVPGQIESRPLGPSAPGPSSAPPPERSAGWRPPSGERETTSGCRPRPSRLTAARSPSQWAHGIVTLSRFRPAANS